MDAQLKKGLIEICVLVVLKQQDSYGYQIIKDISLRGTFRINVVSHFEKAGSRRIRND